MEGTGLESMGEIGLESMGEIGPEPMEEFDPGSMEGIVRLGGDRRHP